MSMPNRHRSPAEREAALAKGSGEPLGVPPPQRDEIDALVEAVSTGARQVARGDTATNAAPRVSVAAPTSTMWRWSLRPRVAIAIAAFSIGVAGTVWTLRTMDPRPAPEPSADAPRLDTPVLPSRAFATVVPSAPISPSSLSDMDLEAARSTVQPTAAEPMVLVLDTPARDRVMPTERARTVRRAAPTNVETRALAPEVTTIDATPTAPSAIVAAPIEAPPVLPKSVERTTVASSTTSEESAVLGTVEDYRRALEQLDVDATAELWPSVDRRMLTRAFSSLKAQEVSFETCDVMLGEQAATARCHGTAQYQVKIGSAGARVGRFEWLFSMRKRGDAWRIDGVTASPLSSTGQQ